MVHGFALCAIAQQVWALSNLYRILRPFGVTDMSHSLADVVRSYSHDQAELFRYCSGAFGIIVITVYLGQAEQMPGLLLE